MPTASAIVFGQSFFGIPWRRVVPRHHGRRHDDAVRRRDRRDNRGQRPRNRGVADQPRGPERHAKGARRAGVLRALPRAAVESDAGPDHRRRARAEQRARDRGRRDVERRRRVGRDRSRQRRSMGDAEHRRRPGSVQTWFNVTGTPQVGFAFDGVGGATRASTAVFSSGRQHAGAAELRLDERHDPAGPDGRASCTSSCSSTAAPPRRRRSTGSRSCRPRRWRA